MGIKASHIENESDKTQVEEARQSNSTFECKTKSELNKSLIVERCRIRPGLRTAGTNETLTYTRELMPCKQPSDCHETHAGSPGPTSKRIHHGSKKTERIRCENSRESDLADTRTDDKTAQRSSLTGPRPDSQGDQTNRTKASREISREGTLSRSRSFLRKIKPRSRKCQFPDGIEHGISDEHNMGLKPAQECGLAEKLDEHQGSVESKLRTKKARKPVSINRIRHRRELAERNLPVSPEKVESLNLLIKTLKSDTYVNQRKSEELKQQHKLMLDKNEYLQERLNMLRANSLKLEELNGHFIAESMRHKYLRAEITQLTTDLERQKASALVKQQEEAELEQELDRLKTTTEQYERQCRESMMESEVALQKLREAANACDTMKMINEDGMELRRMLSKIQCALGRVRVLVALKPTVHESCVQYNSSSELAYYPPLSAIGNAVDKTVPRKPILCKLSHIIQPGSCNPLEIYQEISTTIDGIVDGMNACVVAAGPSGVGKTNTMFGETMVASNHGESVFHKKFIRQRRIYLHQLRSTSFTNVMELTRSREFASYYGLLGLALIHLLQCVSLRSLFGDEQEEPPNRKQCKITLSVFSVPLTEQLPVFDFISNRIADSVPVTDSQFPDPLHIEHKTISSFLDVVRSCECLHRRLHNRMAQTRKDTQNAGHNVVLIKVQIANAPHEPRHRTHDQGTLVMIDMAGLRDDEVPNDGADNQQPPLCWIDMTTLCQTMRSNPNPGLWNQTRLLQILKPLLAPKKKLGTNTPAYMFLLHLPCDKARSGVILHCLRLGLWLKQLNREDKSTTHDIATQKTSTETTSATKVSKSVACRWRIGTIGHPINAGSRPSSSVQKEHGFGQPRLIMQRCDSLPHPWSKRMAQSHPTNIQRTNSVG